MKGRTQLPPIEAHLTTGLPSYVWHITDDRVTWSPEMRGIYGAGTPPDTENGFLDTIHPDDRMRVEAETTKVLSAGDTYCQCFRIVRPDGDVRVVIDHGRIRRDANGSPLVAIGTNTDITDIPSGLIEVLSARGAIPVQAVPALTHSGAGASQLASIVEWDIAADRVKVLLGGELRKAQGLDFVGTFDDAVAGVHPEDRDMFLSSIEAALAAPDGRYANRFRALSPDGTVRVISETGQAERNNRGDPVRLIIMSRDETAAEEPARDSAALAEATGLIDALFNTAPVGLGLWDRELRFVRVNQKLAEINGIPPMAHIGRRPDELLPDLEGLSDILERWRDVIATGKPWLNVEVTGTTPADPDTQRHWREHFFPVTVDGRNTGLAAIIEEITEQRTAERALRDNAARVRQIMDGGLAMMGLLDADGRVIEANAIAHAAMTCPAEQVIGRPLWDCLPGMDPPGAARRIRAALRRVRAGAPMRFDADLATGDGQRLVLDVSLRPVRDGDGAVRQIIASAFDVTGRKEQEEAIAILLKELAHREKNLLSLVQAIARQTAASEDGAFLKRFNGRISALARTTDLLIEPENAGTTIPDIVTAQLAHLEDMIGGRIRLDGPPIEVGEEAGRALGMVFHELATNALKYGALSGATGNVDLTWEETPEGFVVAWREHGGPPVAPPSRRGFGALVLEKLVENAVGGKATLDFAPDGIAWTLRGTRAMHERAI